MSEDEISTEPKVMTQIVGAPKVRMPIVKAIKDAASMELMKPVSSRMRKRYKEILLMSRAVSTKVMRGMAQVWTTIEPDMHISSLRLTTKNGVGTISYHRYELDGKGNKKYTPNFRKIRNSSGDMVEIEISGTYKHECLVIETIEYMKPLKVEEIKEFIE